MKKRGCFQAALFLFRGCLLMKLKAELIDAVTFGRTLKRISHEITEKNKDISSVCLVGIKTRGVPLASIVSEH